MSEFKQGDLVKIKDGTEDVRMPNHRIGLIIEQVKAKGKLCDVFNIFLKNVRVMDESAELSSRRRMMGQDMTDPYFSRLL